MQSGIDGDIWRRLTTSQMRISGAGITFPSTGTGHGWKGQKHDKRREVGAVFGCRHAGPDSTVQRDSLEGSIRCSVGR